MSYVTVPDFSAGNLTSAELNVLVDSFNALFPVGMYAYMCRAATTVETLVNGVWLECNATSVLRATYPDLNTLLSGLSYPFGSADGTHMTLPDAQGRALVSMASGGHADVDALGDSDALTKTSRSPKHNSTNTLSVGSFSLTGTPSVTDPGHTHPGSDYWRGGSPAIQGGTTFSANATSTVSSATTGITVGRGTLAVSGGSLSGTVGPGGTRPNDLSPWLVGGCLFIKAKS